MKIKHNVIKIISLCFFNLIALSSCNNKREPSALENFLTKYDLVYPAGYDFAEGYYNLSAFHRIYADNSSTYSAENFNITGKFDLKFKASPYYKFALSEMNCTKYLVWGAGAKSPYERHDDILWNGDNLHHTLRFNVYAPDEAWGTETFGTDQVKNITMASRFYNINYVIDAARFLSVPKNNEYLGARTALFADGALIVYYYNYYQTTTITLNFDEELKLTKYVVSIHSSSPDAKSRNAEMTQILTPLAEFSVTVPTTYAEAFVVGGDTFEIDLFYNNAQQGSF